MFVAEKFISNLIKIYDKHPVSTTEGETWYPSQDCKFLKLIHPIRSSFEKSIIIERTMQYIKDRTHNLMTIFHVKRRKIAN